MNNILRKKYNKLIIISSTVSVTLNRSDISVMEYLYYLNRYN